MPALRVGHKGADDLVPGNTPASFDAALDVGVDMIEFDVLEVDGRLVLAHDFGDARKREPTTLEDGLDHLAAMNIPLDVDLKLPGYEERVVKALQDRDLVDRSLISSQYPRSLAAVRALEPKLRLGWSVPRATRDYTKSKLYAVPAYAALRAFRAALPRMAAKGLRERRYDAVMAHWLLVSPALIKAVKTNGGEIYVWTVDDADKIKRLEQLSVTGVITNDPRLFESALMPNA
jgi:glycerophosphoryl diester phosphodiesterase